MKAAIERAPQRLPRGRHGLTREEVVRSQRQRILRALAETMTEKGYVDTSVADVLRAAGVSRETFYQQFSSKQDCFMSAYEAAVGILLSGISEALSEDATRVERLDRALGAYLAALSAEPDFARLFLLEVYAAGPRAQERRAESQQQFVELLNRSFDARSAEERLVSEVLVAATSSMVTTRLAANDLAGLEKLRAPLTELASRMLPG